MSTLKNILYFFIILIYVLFTGCAVSYAPSEWLPDKDDVPKSTSGGWITIVIEDSTKKKGKRLMQYGGEFIAVDDENVYLLYNSLYVIKKDEIIKSTLEIDRKNTGMYGLWTAMGIPSTCLNGKFLIITFPLWTTLGIPVVADEANRDRYAAEPPDTIYWNDINRYSRFPQGVEGINLAELQPIFESPMDTRLNRRSR
jgi:hypothetical protein